MADTDRKLLELAAKAAGIVLGEHARFIGDHPQLWFHSDARNHPMCRKPNRPGNVPWNPLTDDGDALRLANKLCLEIRHVHGQAHAGMPKRFWSTEGWFPDGDRDAATRRAIVRAAAEIGRAMS